VTEGFELPFSELTPHSRIRGCLLGGAVGDAIGAPVEFLSLQQIQRRFGTDGIRDYAPAYGRRGAITDATQMTLFTAEGLLRATMRMGDRGICHVPSIVHHAYLRWLLTQHERPTRRDVKIRTDGWLFGVQALHHRRAPGKTCLDALRAAKDWGLPAIALNTSKGCGGVMRIAPLGLFKENDDILFAHAVDIARLTHGHPSGFLTAGYLVVVIAALLRGQTLITALQQADVQLGRHEGHEEVVKALTAARALAAHGRPEPREFETLGSGLVAEEALAIAVCCALTATDFADGITRSANHSGDSSNTAAITGSILGTQFGDGVIPAGWLNKLELRDQIAEIADDIYEVTTGATSMDAYSNRYPPN
jgi:ADP-ribosyl-[dinitrogen reductase] hydrolase